MCLSERELDREICAALAGHTVMTLATTGPDGHPHAVSLMYAADGHDLFWLSDPTTLHSVHLHRSARCAVTVAGQYDDFTAITGLKMSGAACRLRDVEAVRHGISLLGARYSFLRGFESGDLARHLDKAGVYRFCPDAITLIDNTRRFGFKQTLDRSGATED